MLIRAYGLLWNPDTVEWGSPGQGNKGSLRGRLRRKGHMYEIDFWEAQGVYVLHADFKSIYVGKADTKRLGPRVRDHLVDRFAGRWDMFSWFSVSTVATTYGGVRAPGQRWTDAKILTDTLEALAILIADPALNRRRESLPGASQAEQLKSPHPKTIRRYLEEIIWRLDEADA